MVNEYEKPNNTPFLLVEMRPIKKLEIKKKMKLITNSLITKFNDRIR